MNQHSYGAYNPSAAAAAAGYRQQHHQQQQPPNQVTQQQPQLQPQAPITSPSLRDILNGRGQGVQRHPGNVKYRTLVFVNKGLYAKCPRSDKIKISKGIVAAVRELGGRFLELDERTGIYRDIGDKKATEKTSQALREGQTKIRKQMYDDEKKNGAAQAHDMPFVIPGRRDISSEGYFGYSVQVLESLYFEDGGAPPAPNLASVHPQAAAPQPVRSNPTAFPAPPRSGDADAAAIARALEQFPGAAATQPAMPPQPFPNTLPELRPSMGRLTEELARQSTGRFTNVSMSSILSLGQMLDSARRGTDVRESDLSGEIRDLIRLSEPQLIQVESMNMDVDGHADKEVLFDENDYKDRVSELRVNEEPRMTDSTNYSRTSLMDASMMTIDMEDMSLISGTVRTKRQGDDRETADLLLRLSGDSAKI